MNIWMIILLVFIGSVFIFFLSSNPHKVAYIVFIIWFFCQGDISFQEKINSTLEKNFVLNIIYEPLIWLLLIYCIIGVIEAVIRIFIPDFAFEYYIISAYRKRKSLKKDKE